MNPDDHGLPFLLAREARQRAARRRRRAQPGPRRATPPARSPAQRAGDVHEEAAARLLAARGLRLLARNLRCRHGEIDLAMREGDTLVLVEVRARRNGRYGGAAASINAAKQARLARAAACWLPRLARAHWAGATPAARFDAVVFEGGRPAWLRGVFWMP